MARKQNLRFVVTGCVMLLLAGAFFVVMLSAAPRSTDPVALMRTVGQVSGVVGGLGVALLIAGLVGKPTSP
jgi:hypothetical protein